MVMEELKILINSAFNNQGFKAFEKQLKSLKMESFTPQLAKLSPSTLSGMFPDMKKINLKFDVFKGAPKQAMASAKAMSLAFRNGFKSPIEQYMPEIQKSLDNLFPEPKKKMTTFDNVVKKTIKQMDSEIGKIKPVELKSAFKELGGFSDLTGFSKQNKDIIVQNAWLKRFGVQIDQTTGSYTQLKNGAEATTEQMANIKKASPQFQAFSKNVERSAKQMKNLGLDAENASGGFKMYYLSVMFFGMQLQRTFSRIATTSLNTFMKITEGSTSAGQGIMVVQAAFETLKYSVGSALATALEPLLPTIIGLIDKFIEFTDTHQQLVATIILGALAFGTLLFFIGQVGLGIGGIVTFVKELGLTFGITGGVMFAIIIGAIALVAIFLKAWNEFPNTVTPLVKGAFSEIKEALKGLFEAIGNLGNTITGGKDKWVSWAAIAVWSVSVIGAALEGIIGILELAVETIVWLISLFKVLGDISNEFFTMGFVKTDIAKDLENLKDASLALAKTTKDNERESVVGTYAFMGPGKIYDMMITEKNNAEAVRVGEKIGEKVISGYTGKWGESGDNTGQVIGESLGVGIKQGVDKSGFKNDIKSVFDEFSFMNDYLKVPTSTENNLNVTPTINSKKFSEGLALLGDLTKGTPYEQNLEKLKELIDSDTMSTDTLVKSTEKLQQTYTDMIPSNTGTSSYANVNAERERLLTESGRLTDVTVQSTNSLADSYSALTGVLQPTSDRLNEVKKIFGTNATEGLNKAVSSVSTTTDTLKTQLADVGTFISETFNKQIESSTGVLWGDESAANAAASAMERYNRAKQGATGA